MTTDASGTSEINENLIEDLQAAVDRTFSQMFGTPVQSSFKTIGRDETPSGDISVMITLTTNEPQGALMMTFPKETMFALLQNFYKRSFAEIDNTVLGAIGEISNIVYGVFKQRVRSKGLAFGMAMPQIAAGAMPRVPNIVWMSCGEFSSKAGPFHVLLLRVKLD